MAQPSLPIRAARVGKVYGPVTALDDVSLEVGAGEFLTLLGPSGSGKTTLLNIIAGFTRLDAGRVYFGERDVTLEPPHRRDLGLVFQSYALFPHMDVAGNVGFPLLARRVPREEIRRRVERALALVQLQGFERRRISQLSGGQKQRVALARAVVFEPKIILMDEPLSALDKQLREHMQIELRHLHRQLAATIVYVTHDQREALTMSDRVAVMNQGRLVQVDRPQALYEAPASRFVAEFVGESTLVPVERQGEHAVTLGAAEIRCAQPVPSGGRLLLALRAEKLLPAGEGDADANRIEGTVAEIVYQGDSVLVFVDLPGGHRLVMRRPAHRTSLAAVPQAGAPISLGLSPHDAVVVTAD